MSSEWFSSLLNITQDSGFFHFLFLSQTQQCSGVTQGPWQCLGDHQAPVIEASVSAPQCSTTEPYSWHHVKLSRLIWLIGPRSLIYHMSAQVSCGDTVSGQWKDYFLFIPPFIRKGKKSFHISSVGTRIESHIGGGCRIIFVFIVIYFWSWICGRVNISTKSHLPTRK